jgi:nicotinate-nucleotide--dimethylbenzimidazole phosphoribosyltransferase
MNEQELIAAMRSHLDNLTKPKGSLGKLEDYAVKLAAVQNRVPPRVAKKAVYVFAGDHGVVEEGVSLYPQEVTFQMVLNFLGGGAAINALARGTGWDVYAVDAGVAADFPPVKELPTAARFVSRKIGHGSRNFVHEDALTEAELDRALGAGTALAADAAEAGYDLVAIGDMGIGNTTTAAALLVALGMDLDAVVDRGTGIDDAMLEKKRAVVQRAIAARGPCADAKEALRKVGGFDLAMMAGFALGLKNRGICCVMDGFPVSSAVYAAWRMDGDVTKYCFAGHRSRVKGHGPILAEMGLEPIVSLEMRLGEGTGAVIGGFLVELAAKAASEMASFDSVAVSKSERDERNY